MGGLMGPAAERPVGVAILGAAHLTHAWAFARALSALPGARGIGVHDADPGHAEWIRRDFAIPFVADAEALVAAPDVDAVVVCSATADHRAHVGLAAAHGRHVLCDKPIATTVEDARAMVAGCEAAGVQLHLAFAARFQPLVGRARDAVRAGRLGELVGLVGGNRGRPPLPPSFPAWITDPVAAGGGALIDHSVHVTDAMRHVSGLEVTEVSAEAGALLWDCGVDDVAVLTLRFANGAVGSVDPSWSVPDGNPWDYDFFLRLVGTEGSLDITPAAESLHLVTVTDGHPRGLRLASFAEDADLAMLAAFVASVRAGAVREPCATGHDGLRALEIALAGYRSSATGAVVEVR
ncbi:Gfo/Idh/MocA family oxidoreductase [Jiangella ureilytica]|uniref:Gfo/Idh/MocA family oxidoreductase n=1 Tax=Jiangella ureilytica TaxID=2530374 RepID=A0A4R4RNJ4_9ACTN|nr:Gfo/Idh/MocA family oxidoreductase [Jiangella ureilytica]TDC51388.1 Gfo/Idh/MocA family oxidoreductase [Jiangella ureilytica]